MFSVLAACGGPHAPVPHSSNDVGQSSDMTYSGAIGGIFRQRCGMCHSAGAAIPNWEDYNTVLSKKNQIFKRVVVDRTMPPASASTITDSERQELGKWIQAGAPYGNSPVPGPAPTPEPNPGPAPGPEPVIPPEYNAVKDQLLTCFTCHDNYGNSSNDQFPRLAGQNADYLLAELRAFRAKTRNVTDASPMMWAVAESLSDDQMKLLAKFFSTQKSAPNPGFDPEQAKIGKILYEKGDLNRRILDCATCHGKNGEGADWVPALAGQHGAYVIKQLGAFKAGERPEAKSMPVVGKDLTDQDITAVANYIQSLNGP